MMTTQCVRCRHYKGELTCAAFPERIPDEILVGDHDHTKPVADEKVLFELNEPEVTDASD